MIHLLVSNKHIQCIKWDHENGKPFLSSISYEPYKSKTIKITMRCAKSNIPMAIENKENNVYGFQFHPESFLTENGNFIIKKILSA